MSIKLISFDFWSTLYHNSPSLSEKQTYVILQLLKRTGEGGITESSVRKATDRAWGEWHKLWVEKNITLGVNEWLTFVLENLQVEPHNEYVSDCCDQLQSLVFTGNTLEVPGVRSALDILNKQYRLSIISDTGLESGAFLRNLLKKDKLDLFDYYIFSDELGRSKPHNSGFKTLLTYFHLNPDEVVHIGDTRRTDIAGAKALGINTIRFSGCKDDKNSNFDEADLILNDYSLLPEIIKNFSKYKKETYV